MKIVILAGGSGTRLWPASRLNAPKQIISLIGQKTLLQQTYERMLKAFKPSQIFISINQKQKWAVKKQLPKINDRQLIIEPQARNTAAAIGLATLLLSKNNSHEVIVTVNSDHYIKDPTHFLKVIKIAGQAAKTDPDNLYLLGLKPQYPETGYGYIQIGKRYKNIRGQALQRVISFKEKPDLKTAQRYLKAGNYLWNPGYFIFRADFMMQLFLKHLPNHYLILQKIRKNLSSLKSEFKKIDSISLDYGIVEKAESVICLPTKFNWSDIGHWRTVHEVLNNGHQDNLIKGQYLGLDSKNNLIYSLTNKLVTTIGLNDYIIIDTKDCLLVCPKDRAQDVKKIVESLKSEGLKKYL